MLHPKNDHLSTTRNSPYTTSPSIVAPKYVNSMKAGSIQQVLKRKTRSNSSLFACNATTYRILVQHRFQSREQKKKPKHLNSSCLLLQTLLKLKPKLHSILKITSKLKNRTELVSCIRKRSRAPTFHAGLARMQDLH